MQRQMRRGKQLRKSKKLNIAIVSTYLPTQCGIAKFSYSLQNSLLQSKSANISVLRMVIPTDRPPKSDGIDVHPIKKQERDSYLEAAEYINSSNVDVVNVQHEFGIFGGSWGRYILDFMVNVRKPIVTVLHTLEPDQSGERAEVFKKICRLSEKVIVMVPLTSKMLQRYDLEDTDKVTYIPHGVPSIEGMAKEMGKRRLKLEGKTVMVSFGLIGSGKGFEYSIDAIPDIVKKHKDVVYLIIGQTHPNVRKVEGDRYLNTLKQKVKNLGIQKHVRFVEKFFLSEEEFSKVLVAGDIFVAPYLGKHQISSGALVYAMAHKMCIITTPFTHAKHEIDSGVGYLVKHQNSKMIADAVNELLDDPKRMKRMQENAYRRIKERQWPNIARKYLRIFREAARTYN